MPRLPPILDTEHFTIAELCAARIDGEVMAIGDAWCPVDEPDLPALRAASIAPRSLAGLGERLIAERLTAAWVHGAVAVAPTRRQFCIPYTARSTSVDSQTLVVREVSIGDDDITTIGGVGCTTIGRTAFDLLRDAALDEHIAVAVCLSLHRIAGSALMNELEGRLETAARMPHLGLARARFAQVAQPSLTR